MFSHPNTYYNSEYDLYKLINKEENLNKKTITTKMIYYEDIKCCVLCLEDETESNLEFFDYTNNAIAALTIPFVDRIITKGELNLNEVKKLLIKSGKLLSSDMGYKN